MRLDSPPKTTAIAASALFFVLFVAFLASCKRETTCTTEVTAGSGTFRGSETSAEPRPLIERASMRAACGEMCAKSSSGKTEGCVSRCVVDVESQKIGARTTCKEGSGR